MGDGNPERRWYHLSSLFSFPQVAMFDMRIDSHVSDLSFLFLFLFLLSFLKIAPVSLVTMTISAALRRHLPGPCSLLVSGSAIGFSSHGSQAVASPLERHKKGLQSESSSSRGDLTLATHGLRPWVCVSPEISIVSNYVSGSVTMDRPYEPVVFGPAFITMPLFGSDARMDTQLLKTVRGFLEDELKFGSGYVGQGLTHWKKTHEFRNMKAVIADFRSTMLCPVIYTYFSSPAAYLPPQHVAFVEGGCPLHRCCHLKASSPSPSPHLPDVCKSEQYPRARVFLTHSLTLTWKAFKYSGSFPPFPFQVPSNSGVKQRSRGFHLLLSLVCYCLYTRFSYYLFRRSFNTT
ncbi:hypothetical protein B0H66DRAFT_71154 [Apodospora peruviana]|uniref:Uncharacterized protein n=1 Tax=Apodospora peruviana TaxID=516989 RepID=A0AAE0ISV5_9PEZI|nr:hypothetical protein B0H66DRAFT_71154 [Apodospora peruviana]